MVHHHPTINEKDLYPKKIMKYSDNRRHARDATKYLKIFEYAPHIWHNLSRRIIDVCLKIHFKGSEHNQNPQLVSNKEGGHKNMELMARWKYPCYPSPHFNKVL